MSARLNQSFATLPRMIADPARPAAETAPPVPPALRGHEPSRVDAPARPAPRAGAAPSGGAALVLQARALRHERCAPAAAAVLNGLALMLDCERVCLGLALHGGLEVVATNTGVDHGQRQNFTDALAAAMQEAVDQRATIVYPLPVGSTPVLCFAHGELTRANGGLSLLTVPIVGAGSRLIAILGLQGPESRLTEKRRAAVTPALLEAAADVATALGGGPR